MIFGHVLVFRQGTFLKVISSHPGRRMFSIEVTTRVVKK